jgi:hypothetical protein
VGINPIIGFNGLLFSNLNNTPIQAFQQVIYPLVEKGFAISFFSLAATKAFCKHQPLFFCLFLALHKLSKTNNSKPFSAFVLLLFKSKSPNPKVEALPGCLKNCLSPLKQFA